MLCVTGWHASGDCGDSGPVIRVAAGLELFHAFALIHDDIMDNSDTRRGRPTIHRAVTTHYAGHRKRAEAEHFGVSSAILLGDLALIWSDELLHTAGLALDQLAAILPFLDLMRIELVYGQYLDLLTVGRLTDDVDATLTVIRYKTAKYTIERPLHIGTALAGVDQAVLDACTAYALPLGEAFQLRDDLLGVFGNPAVTGKPVMDDLREGKATALIARALHHATASQAATLHHLVGNPELDQSNAATVRDILTATDARAEIETMIRDRCRQALAVLDTAPVRPAAADALRSLACVTTERAS